MIYFLVALGFLVRALPRFILPHVYNSDSYFHLYCASVIRQNRFSLPQRLPRVLLPNHYNYPFLYHLLLACFPLRARLWVERLTGAIFDSCSILIVYLFSSWLLRSATNRELSALPLLVAALYAFSPALMRIGSGPRAYNGSPRPMGEVLYLLHITLAYYSLATRSLLALIVALLAGAALMITSKFANQVMVLFGAGFVVFVSRQYLFLWIACLLLAIAATKGHAWRAFVAQVKHSLFYARHLQAVFLFPHIRTIRAYIRTMLVVAWRAVRRLEILAALRWYFSETYFPHLLVTAYPQFLAVIFWLGRWSETGPVHRFLVIWAVCGLLCFALTKYRHLLFLGEGERYLEFALFPSLFLAVEFILPGCPWVVVVSLGYFILASAFFLFEYVHLYKGLSDDFPRTEALFAALNGSPPGVVMPIGSLHYQTLYRSRLPVLTHGANMDETMLEEFRLVYGNYPYPSERFEEIVARYDASYIVTDRAHWQYFLNNVLKAVAPLAGRLEILGETSSLLCFKILRKGQVEV